MSKNTLASIVDDEIETIEQQLRARRELALLVARHGGDADPLLADVLRQENRLLGVVRLARTVASRSDSFRTG